MHMYTFFYNFKSMLVRPFNYIYELMHMNKPKVKKLTLNTYLLNKSLNEF